MVSFEKLLSRNISLFISEELDLAGIKTTVDAFFQMAALLGLAMLILVTLLFVLAFKTDVFVSVIFGIGAALFLEIFIYLYLEFKIEQRKNFMEGILPDYLQITAANIRSGISLDKAMVFAARPEFNYFSEDVKLVAKNLYAGDTLQNSLGLLAKRYRSLQLKHTVRMVIEALQYGGGMTDLLNQVAKDLRNQEIVQKEISGQLFMYTIFIAFAALIGAPVLYALTNQMICITYQVWNNIGAQSPGGALPTAGISFLRPTKPQVTPTDYHDFALGAIFLITGFGAFISSAISTGSIIKGIRYFPIFILVGFAIFIIVSIVIGGIFTNISGISSGGTHVSC
ncbi:MAG: type II secretion system F family protein [Candidatus Micrarchaeota archaeon]|nr:type II secretion system F family protein [Candidatus Micrarchaeota archaeon]MDE1847767.1 type II secretion system F family protein [Candidatus Micrarchaeota archaeon]MDE1863910.1 type II secretion system F family protein [Candidatus Micrarchaeota archaeon]